MKTLLRGIIRGNSMPISGLQSADDDDSVGNISEI